MIIFTLPNLLLYKANGAVSAVTIGMILLLEPVTGIVLDVVFLNSPLTANIIIGGLIILGANILLIREKQSRNH